MRKLLYTIFIMLIPVLSLAQQTIFTEDFESPVVTPNLSYPPDYFFQDGSGTPYRASPSPYPRWLRSDNGFGNAAAGVHTNAGFSGQKLGLRYTNSGYSTDEGEIGTIDLFYAKYTMTCEVVERVVLSNTGGVYKVQLVAYASGSDRQNFGTSGDVFDGEFLAEATGTTTSNDTLTLTYTTDPILDADLEGYDLGIRVDGATSSASYDDFEITYEPIVPYVKEINKAVVISGKLFVPSGATPKIATLWTPADIDTVAWYDAYTTASIGFSAGTSVSAWYDKSGNGYDLTQTSGSEQPTYIASDPLMNNYPTVFSGDNIAQQMNSGTISGSVKRAYFVTYQGAGTNLTWSTHGSIFAVPAGSLTRLTGRQNDFEIWDNQSANNFDLNGSTYRNGDQNNVAPPNTLGTLPMPATLWRTTSATNYTGQIWRVLGNSGPGWASYYGGLSELIFTDGTEDLATQQKIEGYLAWKWGIQDNLPSDHPYKNRRP